MIVRDAKHNQNEKRIKELQLQLEEAQEAQESLHKAKRSYEDELQLLKEEVAEEKEAATKAEEGRKKLLAQLNDLEKKFDAELDARELGTVICVGFYRLA